MSQEPLETPEPLLVPDVGGLVERYAPELHAGPAIDRPSAFFALGMLSLYVGLGGLNLYGSLGAVLVAVLTMVLGVLGYERYRRRAFEEFERIVRHRPWELFGAIADQFRRDLSTQRARLLGPGSEWGRARAPLEEAYQEARRSQAYWEERGTQDPAQPRVHEHLDIARQLSGKFRAALDELDARSQILLDFFNSCEAKLSALEHSQRDVEESRRLAALSQRAEDVTLDAQQAIAGIGRDVLRQALEVGEALGAAERLRIQYTAGEIPVEEIETVADRILDSAESERRVLAALVAAVGSDED